MIGRYLKGINGLLVAFSLTVVLGVAAGAAVRGSTGSDAQCQAGEACGPHLKFSTEDLTEAFNASKASEDASYGCIPASNAVCCFPGKRSWSGCLECPSNAIRPSTLYGCKGELFDAADSRLMDWSYAGYMFGEEDPPSDPPVMGDIKEVFGAKGDGITDDTAAFELAISSIWRKGTIFIPEGTYVITRRLDITYQVSLKGAGAGRTILYFPQPLSEAYGNSYDNGVSQWSFGPSFITWNGNDVLDPRTLIANVTASAKRGDDVLQVDSLEGLHVGKFVRLSLDNVDNDMADTLNGGKSKPLGLLKGKEDVIRFTGRVAEVMTNPSRIRLDRRVPFDVSTKWRPEIHEWTNEYYGAKRNFTGISDLTIRFPDSDAYQGETREDGYNAIYMYQQFNGWVKNLVIENADMGVVLDGCGFMTVQNVTFISNRASHSQHSYYGGKGVWLKGSYDSVVRDFSFDQKWMYEIYISYFAFGNVIADGSGPDMSLEMIYGTPYANLFTNISLGAASEPWGFVERGQDASSLNTFWNVRSDLEQVELPPKSWAPSANFIGVQDVEPPKNSHKQARWHVESASAVWPTNLWKAQRRARGKPVPNVRPLHQAGPGYGCLEDGTKCCFKGEEGCPLCTGKARNPSSLFGCQGELWTPDGRLYDWSYAGYKNGDEDVPSDLPVAANVRDYGAKGDGIADDTLAVSKALENMTAGVLHFPAGTYILTAVLSTRKAILFKGDGMGKTILKFPKSKTELYGNTWPGGHSQYSHGGGFLTILGWDPTGRNFTKLTEVVVPAARGSYVLYINSTDDIAVGQMVRLLMADPGDGTLLSEIHGNRAVQISPYFKGFKKPVRFLSRVTSKGKGWIKLERPIPVRVDLAWSPEIHKFMPDINGNAGFEGMTIDFPVTKYPGHWMELGWDGIHMNQLVNSWVKNVRIQNGDLGVYWWGQVFSTIDNLQLLTTGKRGTEGGHRGIWLEHGSDNMIKNFEIHNRMIHDLSLAGFEHGSVFMDGWGADINLDHHRSAPYMNLFTNLDVGLGARVFMSGGAPTWGTHSAMYGTFHNLRGSLDYILPTYGFGPQSNFIGLPNSDIEPRPAQQDWFVEDLVDAWPTNLHQAFKSTFHARRQRAVAGPAGHVSESPSGRYGDAGALGYGYGLPAASR